MLNHGFLLNPRTDQLLSRHLICYHDYAIASAFSAASENSFVPSTRGNNQDGSDQATSSIQSLLHIPPNRTEPAPCAVSSSRLASCCFRVGRQCCTSSCFPFLPPIQSKGLDGSKQLPVHPPHRPPTPVTSSSVSKAFYQLAALLPALTEHVITELAAAVRCAFR